MSAGPRLDRILEQLNQTSIELEQLTNEVPAYALESARFCKAEVAVLHRRLSNLRKILTSTRAGA